MMLVNEVFADQVENGLVDSRRLVKELDEREKGKDGDVHPLEELQRKSRLLNSRQCLRIIDENLDEVPSKIPPTVQRLVLSCNELGRKHSKPYPNHLQSVELAGNFLSTFDQCPGENRSLQSLGLSYNELRRFPSIPSWNEICLLDLSYNLFDQLRETVSILKNLRHLRILFLHGNPLSLLTIYRVFVIDSLEKLSVLDDVTITAEERFRSRQASQMSLEHPRDVASLTVTFPPMSNLPAPPPNPLVDDDWPIRKDRYQLRFDWFDSSDELVDVSVPHDKMSNFHRYLPTEIQSSWTEYKPQLEFTPHSIDFNVKNLLPLRDFLFHGTRCRLIHQMTEYWPPGEANNDPKKKPTSAAKDKKVDAAPVKKKKNEDLSKLVIRQTPEEKVLVEFPLDLRSFLEGDHQHSQTFEHLFPVEQPIPIATKADKKNLKKADSIQQERQKSSSSKLSKDKKIINEEIPLPPQPFRCSIHFQLHRYLSSEQYI